MKSLRELLPWPLTVRGGCGEYAWIGAEPTDYDKELSPELVGEYWGFDIDLPPDRSTEDMAREIVEDYCKYLREEVKRRSKAKEQDAPEGSADR